VILLLHGVGHVSRIIVDIDCAECLLLTEKAVLPLRPRHHGYSSMLFDADEEEHTVSDDALQLPVNDLQAQPPRTAHSSPSSARVRLAASWLR